MNVEAQVTVNGSRSAIWAAIADIDNAAKIVSGIESIEVLERPVNGLVGLRWRETRMLFGKPATVEKRITDAVVNERYTAAAEDGGFEFVTTKTISPSGGGATLSERHETRPRTFVATIMSIPMALFFKGTIRKAVLQDLNDIKAAVERQRAAGA